MIRADEGLPFLLKYENIARYEDGRVIILDRRKYPATIEYVRCSDYTQVAQAITDMVTQSGGPWLAAALGMVSAARSVQGLPEAEAKRILRQAVDTLSHARPTTSGRRETYLQRILAVTERALADGKDAEATTLAYVKEIIEEHYRQARRIATYLVSLFPDRVTVLTQCFAETAVGFMILVAKEVGKEIALICPETRPYLQGARLTASVAYDMGVPVTVITDNMPAYILSQGKVDVFTCGADIITLDGYVVNKIGTFQIAIAAHFWNVPFYVVGTPSAEYPTISTVKIEERDPEEALQFMGVRTAKEGVKGYYPAFDITPPKLISAVVTAKGIFSPYDLENHFGSK